MKSSCNIFKLSAQENKKADVKKKKKKKADVRDQKTQCSTMLTHVSICFTLT